jgi:hypothetical protein
MSSKKEDAVVISKKKKKEKKAALEGTPTHTEVLFCVDARTLYYWHMKRPAGKQKTRTHARTHHTHTHTNTTHTHTHTHTWAFLVQRTLISKSAFSIAKDNSRAPTDAAPLISFSFSLSSPLFSALFSSFLR